MSIDTQQLEINVNLYSLQSDFLNHELHYVIAASENVFRFAAWNDLPGPGEKKFYCFLTDEEINIPAGNITLKESYVVKEEPVYPELSSAADFCKIIGTVKENQAAKGIRRFSNDDIETIQAGLQKICGSVKLHVVSSSQAQHMLLVVDDTEISISATMVYFRHKAPFSDEHYRHVQEEGTAQ